MSAASLHLQVSFCKVCIVFRPVPPRHNLPLYLILAIDASGRFRKELGDEMVEAYAGTELGVQSMKASEWVRLQTNTSNDIRLFLERS